MHIPIYKGPLHSEGRMLPLRFLLSEISRNPKLQTLLKPTLKIIEATKP